MSKGPDTASAVQSEGQRGLQTVKTLNTEINTNKTQDEFYELEPVEVLEVYLDGPEIGGKKFPFLPRIGSKIDYTFVGGIKGRFVYSQTGLNSDECFDFLPINPNINSVPTVGEIVIGVMYLGKYFYTTQLNFFGNPNFNTQIGLSTGNTKDADKQTLENTRDKGQVGNYFKQNFDARKLLPREGDFILEGRFGNSIRLGSDLINENQNSPNIILSTGHLMNNDTDSQKKDKKAPTLEHIDDDGSSIYLTTNQELVFTPAVESEVEGLNVNTPSDAPNFSGKNILLDSDRILFNTKNNGSIGIFSSNNIALSSVTSVVVESPSIKIGSNNAEESMVLGDTLKGLLEELINAINALTVPTPVGPSGPPINAPQFSGISAKLQTMLSAITKVE